MKPLDEKVLRHLRYRKDKVLLSTLVKNVKFDGANPLRVIEGLKNEGLMIALSNPEKTFEITQKGRRLIAKVPAYSHDSYRHKAWRIMRMETKFTADDVVEHLDGFSKSVRQQFLGYLRKLEQVEYVGTIGWTKSFTGTNVKRYRLLKNTGPNAPLVISDIQGVYDYNLPPKERWVLPFSEMEIAI